MRCVTHDCVSLESKAGEYEEGLLVCEMDEGETPTVEHLQEMESKIDGESSMHRVNVMPAIGGMPAQISLRYIIQPQS